MSSNIRCRRSCPGQWEPWTRWSWRLWWRQPWGRLDWWGWYPWSLYPWKWQEGYFMVMMYQHSWCWCLVQRGDGACGIGWIVLRRKICPQWCWSTLLFATWVYVLVEVVNRVLVDCVSIFLIFLFCLFFCPRCDSYVAPFGVLWVSLLLGGCLTF